MTGRPKIDANAVMTGYERTGNAAQVAREMGIHENTARQIIRKRLGKCARCGEADIIIGKTMCGPCLEWDKARMKKRRHERLRNGFCTECGEPRSPLSRNLCEKHRIAAAEGNERYHAKQKRNGVQNKTQKKDSLLERYGREALRRWEHADGKCEACGAAYGETSIHLHHIDEDRTNNTFENFACLCFDCHRAVHRLISSRDRVALIAWFERTYPQLSLR